ncbi:LytR C-terminal domain-containing protein [bacterium]|nr:LytR C-terminal domain-containing protein [bacterium]MBU1073023.1 LytR C-terminal domain-containing protein [bacterium]MBU1676865.1 LytR C-terminal domain-containing protein [bacterium]
MRTLRLILLLVVLACAISVGVWATHGGPRQAGPPDHAGVPAAMASRPGGEVADVPGGVVHLVILNGTAESDLAGDFSLLAGRAGCVADRIDNAPHAGFARSLLINRRLSEERAAFLAARLGDPVVLREHDPRATEDAVLVLGADHDRLRGALLSF